MAYIGVQPTAGQYRKLDNISASFNGSTTSFTTSVGGTNVTAGTAQQLIVSLGGVIQQPDTDYTVSTNTITFTTAPTSGLDFFAILMGDALNTVTPSDGSVTTSKLAGSLSVGLTAGSASTPALFFTGDTNNGIFSPSTDAIAVTTAGSERLRVTSAGLVGIGTSSPGSRLTVNRVNFADASATGATTLSNAGITVEAATDTNNRLMFGIGSTGGAPWIQAQNTSSNATQSLILNPVGGNVGIGTTSPTFAAGGGVQASFATFSSFRATSGSNTGTDFAAASDGKGYVYVRDNADLLIGTNNTERARVDSSGRLLVGTSSAIAALEPSIQTARSSGAFLALGRDDTSITDDELLGAIYFYGNQGSSWSNSARIEAKADAAWGTNDYPSKLVFSTTADGASSPTEAMRIRATGNIEMGKADSGEKLAVLTAGLNNAAFSIFATNASYQSSATYTNINRASNSNYNFYLAYSGDFGDLEFRLRGDGNGTCDGAWTGGGADYAEYFEWSDSNPDVEDRRGISVVLDGDKIREAVAGEDPIGAISGNPSVISDAAWNKWTGKYLRDEFGTYIQEDYEIEDEDGNTVVQQRRKLNPAYDPDQEYIPREQRPEWDCVGLMGKLRIRKGQVTGSRWIKMRDISDTVEEWLVR